jgi:uncharacterized membrane protein YgcG
MLMLCARYLDLVSRMHRVNQLLGKHHQQHDMQQHSQQQQRLQLLQLPAADITAAVLHTASLLLVDLSKHIADNTSPQDVAGLLLKPQALHQTALVVATLYGSQLQLKLLHQLRQQCSQPAQHTSSSGSGSSKGSSNGGSSGGSSTSSNSSNNHGSDGPPAAADRAEGVLLCHVQQFLQSEKPLALQPNISAPVVQSWLQHYEASWGELLPPHMLQHVAAAIAAAEGASASQQHPNTTTTTQQCQPYGPLPPAHCLAKASDVAGDASTGAGVSAGSNSRSSSSSGGSGSSGGGISSSGSGSSSTFSISDMQLCIRLIEAAARVLGVGNIQPMCQLAHDSVGMQRVPLLLLSSAVAALSLTGAAAVPAACSCSMTAGCRAVLGSCESSEGQPCAVCSELMAPHVWPTVGLLSLLLQQATMAGNILNKEEHPHTDSSGGSGSSGGDSSGGPTADAASTAVAAACAADGLLVIIQSTAGFLQAALTLAVPPATPFKLPPQQLQQVSLSVQILEAAIRCHVRLRQLVSQHRNAAADSSTDGDAGVEPMLSAAAEICSIAVNLAHVMYDATPGDMTTEVQQVLQAVMSLCHTALSTAQGKPDAAAPAVLLGYVKAHYLLLRNAANAAAVGPTHLASAAAVAAGWFLLGRCLLQLSEQIQLCILQPESHPLSGWLLASAQVWNCSCSTLDHQAVREELHKLVGFLALLADGAAQWQLTLASQASGLPSSTARDLWLDRYELNMVTAEYRLIKEVCQTLTFTFTDPEVLAAVLDPSPAHRQQILQQQEGPALQGFLALNYASSGLKFVGNLLCEAIPNRYFCNNPGCRNAAGVSAGFALVRGAACVCGGCVGSEGAAGAAAAPQEAVAAR